MKGKSLILILMIICILSNNMIKNLEDNLIKRKEEVQSLKRNLINRENEIRNLGEKLNLVNNELANCKNEFLDMRDGLKWQEFFITGYTANSGEQGTSNIVATMFNLDLNRVKNLPIVAVDPKVIPLYSIVEIKNLGVFIALDTGGLIKGNRIDVLCQNKKIAYEITGEYLARILENGKVLADDL